MGCIFGLCVSYLAQSLTTATFCVFGCGLDCLHEQHEVTESYGIAQANGKALAVDVIDGTCVLHLLCTIVHASKSRFDTNLTRSSQQTPLP